MVDYGHPPSPRITASHLMCPATGRQSPDERSGAGFGRTLRYRRRRSGEGPFTLKELGSRRQLKGRRRPAGVQPRFEILQQPDYPVDVGVLVVETVERASEPDRVPRIIALVELLAAGKGRDRGVESQIGRASCRER